MARSVFYPRCKAVLEIVFDGRGAKNSTPYYIEVDCRDAQIGFNGFYEADTFSLTFDARFLPFDPDQVAHCAVHVYLWDAQPDKNVVEWAIGENLMITGIVDDIELSVLGGDSYCKFIGRDNTGILLDAQWDPKKGVQAGGNLRDVVQQIADDAAPATSTARFLVVWNGEDPPPPVGGLHRSTKKKGLWTKPGTSYWDVIWNLCIQHAYVPHIELQDFPDGRSQAVIIIGEPTTQTKQALKSAPRLIHGKTLTRLEIKRKFCHEIVPQIVLVAYDPKEKKEIQVAFPEQRNTIAQLSTDAFGIALATKKDEQLYLPAPGGIIDKTALRRYARMKFYQLGRGETIYTLETRHMSIDGPFSGEEVNLLKIRPGAAIGVQFDPFNMVYLRSLTEIGQRVEYILSLGYSNQMASFIATNMDNLELFRQNYYYNRGDIDYNVEEGLNIKIEAMNFTSEVNEVKFAEAAGAAR